MEKRKNHQRQLERLFLVFAFMLFFVWSVSQPWGKTPDEPMKFDIVKYIVDHGKLPHGGDPAVRNPVWGISYGFTPILAYMIGAIFVKIASFFSSDLYVLYVAARFTSVLCCTGMVLFIIKIGNKLFKDYRRRWLFILLSSMLPQVVFLGSYINNDSLALCSIAMIIYSWLLGMESKWSVKSCILLGIGIGICALSYYNAYGYILTSMILFLVSFFFRGKEKVNYSGLLKKGTLIALIVIAIAGWWFVRSAILYDGDILGLRTTSEYGEKYAIEKLKPSQIQTPQRKGESLVDMLIKEDWLKLTGLSFVGLFGIFCIVMPVKFYKVYIFLYSMAILGVIWKYTSPKFMKNWFHNKARILLEVIFVVNMVIPVLLSLYYSYCSDFQPQGRYIMPMLLPFNYFVVMGIDQVIDHVVKEKIKNMIYCILYVGVIGSPIYCLEKIIEFYS